ARAYQLIADRSSGRDHLIETAPAEPADWARPDSEVVDRPDHGGPAKACWCDPPVTRPVCVNQLDRTIVDEPPQGSDCRDRLPRPRSGEGVGTSVAPPCSRNDVTGRRVGAECQGDRT